MATKTEEEINPVGFLIVFLPIALAFGAGRGGNGGDGGSPPVAEDPCDDADQDHVVRSWWAEGGTVWLRCGTDEGNPGGYRHIKTMLVVAQPSARVTRCRTRRVDGTS